MQNIIMNFMAFYASSSSFPLMPETGEKKKKTKDAKLEESTSQ
jgi:hypothetical protein